MKFTIDILLFLVCITNLFSMRTDPWLTQKSRQFLEEYLETLDNPKILEFGSGGSTIWFSQRTSNLISYEHSPHYFKIVKDYIKDHGYNQVDIRYRKPPYFQEIANFPDNYFDLVLVDARDRLECCLFSLSKLKPGGILMLDNSERPELQELFVKLKNWPSITTYQPNPDEYGFTYEGWQTTWWKKN